jgi:hypothetical protein
MRQGTYIQYFKEYSIWYTKMTRFLPIIFLIERRDMQHSFNVYESWLILIFNDHTRTLNAVQRSYDINRNYPVNNYVAVIIVEDFLTTASTTSMSSVPLQTRECILNYLVRSLSLA